MHTKAAYYSYFYFLLHDGSEGWSGRRLGAGVAVHTCTWTNHTKLGNILKGQWWCPLLL